MFFQPALSREMCSFWQCCTFLPVGMCSAVKCNLNHLLGLNEARGLPGNLTYPSENLKDLI